LSLGTLHRPIADSTGEGPADPKPASREKGIAQADPQEQQPPPSCLPFSGAIEHHGKADGLLMRTGAPHKTLSLIELKK
jgi:hypothetical protein